MATTLAQFTGMEKLSAGDLKSLVDAAHWIGINPDWLAAIIRFESGFDPSRFNAAGSGAVGLIQFMPSTAKRLGTSTDALKRMTFQQQMEYVKKYFEPVRGKLKSLEDAYLAVFYPAAIGKPWDHVIGQPGTAVYEQNKGFDRTGKGYVTKQDVTSTIRNVMAGSKGRIAVAGAAGLGLLGMMAITYGVWRLSSKKKLIPGV